MLDKEKNFEILMRWREIQTNSWKRAGKGLGKSPVKIRSHSTLAWRTQKLFCWEYKPTLSSPVIGKDHALIIKDGNRQIR